MIKSLLTPDRVRSILDGARTEIDAALALRRHHVRYSYSTTGGTLHIRVPARTGTVIVYRTASRSQPLRVAAAAPAGVAPYPYPVPRWTWDD